MSSLKWLSGISMPEPPGNTSRLDDLDQATLPQRIKGATLTPEYLAELDEPIPYVPVSMGIDEYECPEANCDFHVYAVGPDAAPGYLDDMRQEIEEHRQRHADDDGTEAEAIAPVSMPIASSSQAGLTAIRFSHPSPALAAPSIVAIDAQEALNEAAFAWVDADPDHDPTGITTSDLIAAIVRFRAVTR